MYTVGLAFEDHPISQSKCALKLKEVFKWGMFIMKILSGVVDGQS